MPPRSLTNEQAREIRERYASEEGATQVGLAFEYGVGQSVVNQILAGNTYKDAGGPVFDTSRSKKLSTSDVLEIRTRYAEGETQREILKDFDDIKSKRTITCVLRGITHSDKPGPIFTREDTKRHCLKAMRMFSEDDVDELRDDCRDRGKTPEELAARSGCRVEVVLDALLGEGAYKNLGTAPPLTRTKMQRSRNRRNGALPEYEDHPKLEKAINSLDERKRSVLLLRERQGYSYQDISELLAIPVGTVKSRLNRARQYIRSWMGSLDEHDGDVRRHSVPDWGAVEKVIGGGSRL